MSLWFSYIGDHDLYFTFKLANIHAWFVSPDFKTKDYFYMFSYSQ